MKMQQMVLCGAVGAALVAGGVALAQNPEDTVGARRHPNLAAAQRFTQQAYDKVVSAQAANEWDMSGHAAHAKDLLDQADRELKAAAEAANKNHR